jgi:hypothetical protein
MQQMVRTATAAAAPGLAGLGAAGAAVIEQMVILARA